MVKKYSTDQAAKAAGITRETLQKWIREGRVRAPKLQIRGGRSVRLWSKADVEKLKGLRKRKK